MRRILLGTLSTLALSVSLAPVVAANSVSTLARTEATTQVAAKPTVGPGGRFISVGQGHDTSGTARIVTEADGRRYVVLDEQFSTAQGPDLLVTLYRQSRVPASHAEADYISLAPLKEFAGEQRYEIPADVNLDEFESVAIWCRQFNVTFAYATLR